MESNGREIEECVKNIGAASPFSGVAHLTVKGRVCFAKGFGFAVKSEFLPSAVNTRFQIASGSKDLERCLKLR